MPATLDDGTVANKQVLASEEVAGFRVLRSLASERGKEVLLARADGLPGAPNPPVVLKLLRDSDHREEPDFEMRFARASASYARLAHPNVVRLYDYFRSGEQFVWVLEHVDGLSLSDL